MLFRSSGRLAPVAACALFVSALPVAGAMATGGPDAQPERGSRGSERAADQVVRAGRDAPLIDITPTKLDDRKALHPREMLVPARPVAAEPPPPATPPSAVGVAPIEKPKPVAPAAARPAQPAAPNPDPEWPVVTQRLSHTGTAILSIAIGIALLLATGVFLRVSAIRRAVPAPA